MQRLNMKFVRMKKGFTQAELAKAVGVHKNSISNFERGTLNPSLPILQKIAAVLECKIDDIV